MPRESLDAPEDLPKESPRQLAFGQLQGVSGTLPTMAQTMFEKIWNRHVVTDGPGGQTLLYVDRHLLHEGSTSAFGRLEKSGRRVRRPDLSFATADHYLPTTPPGTPIADAEIRAMVESFGRHTSARDITYFGPGDARRGIVHVIGPEQGITQPSILLVCGDSHTATH